MLAKIIDGKALAAAVRASLLSRIAALAARGVRPGLAAIFAGEDAASQVYVRNKTRACEETGLHSEVHRFPASVAESALLEHIARLNADRSVHGILDSSAIAQIGNPLNLQLFLSTFHLASFLLFVAVW